ncbi:MAG TPA: bifunctional UDP-sugar hydrolase/5'-nucleotidase [Ktedonobacteraceae bacterium]|nr:bifunctional UDP-sugar hydrolase/5'-nucleotidase [Ktedonobacteraceae bacterium]
MQSFIILHSNDIHGRVEGLARITTLVEKIRTENPDKPVLFIDAGDVEETASRLSNLTKGTAMHRLLSLAGCDVVTAGNGGIMRYGYQVLRDYSSAARYPLVLSNLRMPDGTPLPGAQLTALLQVGSLHLGVIGITADSIDGDSVYETYFGLRALPSVEVIRELAADLRQKGAGAVILLSHMGLDADRKLASELQEEIEIIIGAHSHHLLPEGERLGRVLIVQAGNYAEYLGRLDILWDDQQLVVQHVSVLPITDAIEPAPRILSETKVIEAEIEHYLDEVVGELSEPLDFATDRECGVANLMADMLREHMAADVAVITASVAFTGPLPPGSLRRGTLWDVCSSSANPGIVTMTGAQLKTVIERGLDLNLAKQTPRAFRGLARGLLHLSGASIHEGQLLVGSHPLELEREYRVAGSDWELESYGGYIDTDWHLRPRYDAPAILREALEPYLKKHSPIRVRMGRLG